MAKQKYQPGNIVGDNGVFFLKEIEPLEANGRKRRRGIFICPLCGNTFECRLEQITQKRGTKSCGCLHDKQVQEMGRKNVKDITGQKRGSLTAICRTNKKASDDSYIWKFQCDCGNTHYLPISEFLCDKTQSCGCNRQSHGERKIEKILKENNITYIREYSPQDCIFPNTNKRGRFDFYLPDYACCIEYDGEQHFKEKSAQYFFDNLDSIQQRDKIKNIYCEKNNIFLIRIPYTDYKDIDFSYLKKKGLFNVR